MSCTDKKYIVKEIIISSDTGLQGPAGPEGPVGPPGPVPDEYPADQVTVTNPGYNNAQEIFDDLLYVPVNITSFSGGPTQYELGSLLTSLTFNWTINKDIISQTLVGPPEMTPVVLTAEQRSVTVTLANLGANASFTLTADDGTQQDVSIFSVQFNNRNYYGDADIPGVIDDAFLLSLPSVLKGNRSLTYTINAIGTQYGWYAIPSRYGTPSFNVGGFDGGFQFITTLTGLSFENNSGYVEDYDVYRTDFPGIGPGLTSQVS